MRLLVLGGTRFLGRHLVDAARRAGHEVTLFHRGETGGELFPELERRYGDRERGDLESLRGGTWDAAVDVPTDQPRWVREATEVLRGAVGRYAYVSSISVYADLRAPGLTEDAPVATCPPEERDAPERYGARKALCEDLVRDAFGERSLVVRPGLIVGPHDPSDRFTYWPRRLARGGEVLAPGDGQSATQLVDARDLAGWMVAMLERGETGTVHATGPAEPLTMRGLLETVRDAVGGEASLRWIDEGAMERHGVRPWVDLPCFVPRASAGMLDLDLTRALGAGLTLRPLEETARDTLAWDRSRPEGTAYAAGLDPAREREVLRALREA